MNDESQGAPNSPSEITPLPAIVDADAGPHLLAKPAAGGEAGRIASLELLRRYDETHRDASAAPPAVPIRIRARIPFASRSQNPGPWIAAAADTIIPLAIGTVAVLVFTLLDQARDALFGALGNQRNVLNGSPRLEGDGLFWWYMGAAIVLGNLLWYTARITAATSIRETVGSSPNSRGARARTNYPRLLAYILMSLLIAAAVAVARDGIETRATAALWAGAGLLVPVLLVTLAQRWDGGGNRWALLSAILTLVAEIFLLTSIPPEGGAWQTIAALACASTMPTVCYVLWVRRRDLFMHSHASADALLQSYGGQLAGFIAAFGLIFAGLAFGRASYLREIGSPAIVVIALSGVLVGLVAVCLMLRAVERRLPGVVAVGVLTVIAAAVLVRLAFKVEPWREVPGMEAINPAGTTRTAPTVALAEGQDIVVNAHGGGLRAAFYTATFLATMDDRSCGAFGERLGALSGVSGGSLGIATYLVERQRVVAAGGWQQCDGKTAVVGALVEDVLRRDHLSPVVARMLTIDLLPFVTPRRGQALLDSWDEAIRNVNLVAPVLPSTEALAMPLAGLTGGIARAPLVLFNATDAANGKIVWMSNRGRWGREAETPGLPLEIELGQAVLHSARFPLVSPVGQLTLAPHTTVLLVDGGLSDNSGAATLARQSGARTHWININGNFERPNCGETQTGQPLEIWSALNALLALRVNQAALGIAAMGAKPPPFTAQLDYVANNTDPNSRCAEIAKLHRAPLGWYMSRRSAEDMMPSVRLAVDNACAQLGTLCRPPQAGF